MLLHFSKVFLIQILKFQLNKVWVSCEGENAADKEHIGLIHMFPHDGFPGYYFPFKKDNGYLSPLVAVWFENPAREF